MALIAVLSRDRKVQGAAGQWPGVSLVTVTRSWGRLNWLALERPVTHVVLDQEAFGGDEQIPPALRDFTSRFPSLGVTLVASSELDPHLAYDLGQRVTGLAFGRYESIRRGLSRELRDAAKSDTTARVQQAFGVHVGPFGRAALRAAMAGAVLGWNADTLATHSGWSRAHLSVRLRTEGLPSAGHLLLWARLLHAGRWLREPGRTAESVSRQLDYTDGSAFRRALRNYLGTTPTGLIEAGGFVHVLRCFLDECGLDDSVLERRSVA